MLHKASRDCSHMFLGLETLQCLKCPFNFLLLLQCLLYLTAVLVCTSLEFCENQISMTQGKGMR